MPKRSLLTVLLAILLTSACSAPPSLPVERDIPTAPAIQPEPDEPVPGPTQEAAAPEPAQDTAPEIETAAPNCLGDEVSPIGQSIADEYESASYDQVMTWFCNGAEFEDILLALETESQTDTPAGEMLQMLADGFTWEEIWQLTGLAD